MFFGIFGRKKTDPLQLLIMEQIMKTLADILTQLSNITQDLDNVSAETAVLAAEVQASRQASTTVDPALETALDGVAQRVATIITNLAPLQPPAPAEAAPVDTPAAPAVTG